MFLTAKAFDDMQRTGTRQRILCILAMSDLKYVHCPFFVLMQDVIKMHVLHTILSVSDRTNAAGDTELCITGRSSLGLMQF